ncbi:MAG: asparagine synthase (glutamine-hydrolyzing) [Bacteroidia bacterium]|nr:asparagine synthase (glutamine-hydrolyzing) [Bacteroidia bacterium]
MCGINGIVGIEAVRAEELVKAMNKALSHRGPDDEGVFTHNNVALGHRRLSIIDLSAAGHQPMSYDGGRYAIVYNGELYNFMEVRNELLSKGAITFTTQTDTEVILAAYAAWGVSCLQKFNGMYAFAIYDKQSTEVFVARDRMGIKPLYYFKQSNAFIFSSEIRSLLTSGLIPRKLDEARLIDYLRYQTVHAPGTIIKDVFMLLPGHYGLLNAATGNFNTTCYWDITSKVSAPSKVGSYNEVCQQVNTLFKQAVERRLVADVPFGAFLSGGIDSSAVVGMMSKVSGARVKTFSITFHEAKYNEEYFSQIIAKKFNTDHHNIKLSAEDFKNELPGALKAMDHPSGDGPNSYVVSKVTKQAGITMALSGLGGDELFAGYDIFKRTKALTDNAWLSNAPLLIRRAGAAVLKNLKSSVAGDKMAAILSLSKVSIENFYPVSRQVLPDEQIAKLVNTSGMQSNEVQKLAQNVISGIQKPGFVLSTVSLLEIMSYMQNVLLRDTDQMSMASALEVRVPFLDYELVEYVLSLNDDIKYPHTPKKLFVDAMGDLLPPEIVNRPKMGFTFPWQGWLKNDLKQFCEERIHSLAKRPMFNEKEVVSLWKRFLNDDKRIIWSRIWYLVVLENWLIENNIED